jgi:hypothetical protein
MRPHCGRKSGEQGRRTNARVINHFEGHPKAYQRTRVQWKLSIDLE